jgi:hypothetical protein
MKDRAAMSLGGLVKRKAVEFGDWAFAVKSHKIKERKVQNSGLNEGTLTRRII